MLNGTDYGSYGLVENEAEYDWQQYYNDEGDEYWYNEKTDETSWEDPFK